MAPTSDIHSACPGLMEGTFVHVMTEDFAKYLIKVGIDADEAKRYVGSTWTITQKKLEGKRVLFVLVSQEYPEFSGIDTLPEGGDCPTAHPMFGGEAVMKFNMSGDRAYDCHAKSEKYGNFGWTETYSPEGIVFDITAKDKGASVKQFWQRQIKEEGWFKFEKAENFTEFAKATGVPAQFHGMENQFKCHFEKNGGDNFTMTEFWGPMKNVFHYKLDEEREYKVEGFPAFDRKMVTTRLGPGKFKIIGIPPSGAFKEEWTCTFCEEGCLWEARELKSGVTAKMWTRRYHNFEGEYKLLTTSGFEEYCSLLGVSSCAVSKIKSDPSLRMTISEREGYVHVKHEGSTVPTRQTTFRFDEEFEYEFPGLADKFKAVETLRGDTIVAVFKGPRFTLTSTTKFTGSFLIMTSTIQGTGITMKKIYEKIN